jgi:hypothetical protein
VVGRGYIGVAVDDALGRAACIEPASNLFVGSEVDSVFLSFFVRLVRRFWMSAMPLLTGVVRVFEVKLGSMAANSVR